MSPKVTQAVDPLFLHMLSLLERIHHGEEPSPQDERLRLRALLDQAEAMVGGGAEWDLIKYAIVAWVDEMLVEAPWSGREWWSNNVMEVEAFKTRSCYEQFFVKWQEASALTGRDALEVYYICVVLGFRGLYRDPHINESLIQSRGLPSDVNAWAKQTALSIRLGQGRPPLAPAKRNLDGAAPLTTPAVAVWAALAATVLIVGNLICYFFLFPSFFQG